MTFPVTHIGPGSNLFGDSETEQVMGQYLTEQGDDVHIMEEMPDDEITFPPGYLPVSRAPLTKDPSIGIKQVTSKEAWEWYGQEHYNVVPVEEVVEEEKIPWWKKNIVLLVIAGVVVAVLSVFGFMKWRRKHGKGL